MKEVGHEDVEVIDKSVMAEVARRSGAGAVVVGSIYKVGEDIRIDVQLQDVETGRLIGAESVLGADVFPLIDDLTGRIRSRLELGDRPEGRPVAEVTTDSLEAYRQEVFGLTENYLRSASVEELNTPRIMTTWGNKEKELTPAHVVLRTLMHFYHHQGQIAAMCRLSGKPIPPGMDFPLSK